jgi:glycoside hydrolase-like protein
MRLLMIRFVAFALAASAGAQQPAAQAKAVAKTHTYLGFDRNDYPGDQALPALRQHFSFVGYWLNNPPGAQQNHWQGKREILLRQGFGFLVLFNGRLDAEIVKAQKSGTNPATLGKDDAAAAIAAAHREHFPGGAVLFLDQEEGGRLLPEQADYLFAWTEAVARSDFRPGVYASGQPVGEGHGQTITTAQDIRSHVAAQHLHKITLWIAQDACPPSNGCTLEAPALAASGTPDAAVWQYAQSPRRKSITAACARTYASDGNCYVADLPGLFIDLNTAPSPDPSDGR